MALPITDNIRHCGNVSRCYALYSALDPTGFNDGITGNTVGMITQGNGWYLQLRANVDKLEASTVKA